MLQVSFNPDDIFKKKNNNTEKQQERIENTWI